MNDLFETLAQATKPEPSILAHLETLAKRSYNNTSFSPERRGEQLIKDYSAELQADMAELSADSSVSAEAITDYKARYERLLISWLHAKSNTFSVMITGGSNFPVRRHEKANRSEDRHYELFREWRLRAKKAIVRKAQPVKTYVSELDRYKAELAGMQRNHELMKQGNKMIAKAKKEGKDISADLMTLLGINKFNADWAMQWGFGLQNNNANMKRVEGMISVLEQKEALRNETPQQGYKFEGGEVVINYEADRIQILFDSRPTTEELAAWKAKGLNSFNWSPSAKAWQRKITPNAFIATKRMFEGKLTKN